MVSSDLFCTLSYDFVFFLGPIIWQLSKNSLFQKRVQKLGFSIFSVLSLNFENSLFWGLLKHYENRGFSIVCAFCCWKGRKQAKNDNWNFWILVFGPKMAVSWRICFYSKKVCWNPYFYCVFRVRAFRAKLSKREILDTHPKKKKILTDNWKAHFWGFFVFSCFSFLFLFFFWFFFCYVLVFLLFWGFKGHVRWPEGPPHLALNPHYLFFLCLFCFCFLDSFLFFWRA